MLRNRQRVRRRCMHVCRQLMCTHVLCSAFLWASVLLLLSALLRGEPDQHVASLHQSRSVNTQSQPGDAQGCWQMTPVRHGLQSSWSSLWLSRRLCDGGCTGYTGDACRRACLLCACSMSSTPHDYVLQL